jgi:hypothetical protein
MKKTYLYPVLGLIVVFIVVMMMIARENKNRHSLVRVSPAFRGYVQAFTSGMVSAQTVIKVRLADDFADTASFNTPLNKIYFNFTPAIKGKTYWSDSRTIEFLPDEPLPREKLYTVNFNLSQLLTVPDSLRTLVFQFRTMAQEISVEVENHKAYSNGDLLREHLNGKLLTSDLADDQQMEQVLRAVQDGRDLPVQWTHDQKKRAHLFQVDSIYRGSTAGKVNLTWDGSPVDSKTEGNMNIEIPALNDFSVLSTRSVPGTQQCVLVQFSDPLKSDQNLMDFSVWGNTAI